MGLCIVRMYNWRSGWLNSRLLNSCLLLPRQFYRDVIPSDDNTDMDAELVDETRALLDGTLGDAMEAPTEVQTREVNVDGNCYSIVISRQQWFEISIQVTMPSVPCRQDLYVPVNGPLSLCSSFKRVHAFRYSPSHPTWRLFGVSFRAQPNG